MRLGGTSLKVNSAGEMQPRTSGIIYVSQQLDARCCCSHCWNSESGEWRWAVGGGRRAAQLGSCQAEKRLPQVLF